MIYKESNNEVETIRLIFKALLAQSNYSKIYSNILINITKKLLIITYDKYLSIEYICMHEVKI